MKLNYCGCNKKLDPKGKFNPPDKAKSKENKSVPKWIIGTRKVGK